MPHGATISIRVLFIALLSVSAVGKLLDMPGFYEVVDSYQVLPPTIIPALAWALALTELGMAVWLATGRAPIPAAMGVVMLHIVYFFWLLGALARGLKLGNCGCFGVFFARPLTAQSLGEDLLLLALAVALLSGSIRKS